MEVDFYLSAIEVILNSAGLDGGLMNIFILPPQYIFSREKTSIMLQKPFERDLCSFNQDQSLFFFFSWIFLRTQFKLFIEFK